MLIIIAVVVAVLFSLSLAVLVLGCCRAAALNHQAPATPEAAREEVAA